MPCNIFPTILLPEQTSRICLCFGKDNMMHNVGPKIGDPNCWFCAFTQSTPMNTKLISPIRTLPLSSKSLPFQCSWMALASVVVNYSELTPKSLYNFKKYVRFEDLTVDKLTVEFWDVWHRVDWYLFLKFLRNMLSPFHTLKIAVAGSTETLVTSYQTTRCHTPERSLQTTNK